MFALIGHPLGHSLSPFIHEKLFGLTGREGGYKLHEIPPDLFDGSIKGIIESFEGLNVTIPYKTRVIPFLDRLDESAERYGAVNCIAKKNGSFTGYNTDCTGFLRSVPEKALSGRFLLLGCGGAGRMMAVEAARHGAHITIAIRESSREKANKLVSEIAQKYPSVQTEIVLMDKIEGHFDLLANSTPVGMYPDTESCPVSEKVIESCENVFDAIYNPRETVLIKRAKTLCKTAVGGMSMLVMQAAKAHEIWYGAKFSDKDIKEIIEEASLEAERFGR